MFWQTRVHLVFLHQRQDIRGRKDQNPDCDQGQNTVPIPDLPGAGALPRRFPPFHEALCCTLGCCPGLPSPFRTCWRKSGIVSHCSAAPAMKRGLVLLPHLALMKLGYLELAQWSKHPSALHPQKGTSCISRQNSNLVVFIFLWVSRRLWDTHRAGLSPRMGPRSHHLPRKSGGNKLNL